MKKFLLVLILLLSTSGCSEIKQNNTLTPKELISEGYHFLIYASQTNNSIELYNFNTENSEILISSKDTNIEYLGPVIGKTGNCFFIKKSDRFDYDKHLNSVVQYNLENKTYEEIGLEFIQVYPQISLSPKEDKLALVFKEYDNSQEAKLGIYDLNKRSFINKVNINNRFSDNPLILLWLQDNETLQLWDTLTGEPAIEINSNTSIQKTIKDYPLYFTKDYKIIQEKDDIYLVNLMTQQQTPLKINHSTGHTFSLSSDGKYLIYGWLRGQGFETLTIKSIQSNRIFQLEMDNHPGTVLGLALW